jgi:hypothetical protein
MNTLVVLSNTLTKLQLHLSVAPQELTPGIWHKELAPVLKCKDGTTASIQASKFHYSEPREDFGPYTEVEMWCITVAGPDGVTEFEYSDDDPSAYVPIGQVVQFIDNHGGIDES